MPDFSHENRHGRKIGKIICGVDEVGRGPLAGPVVAAAAILPLDFPSAISSKIKDSKKMSAKAREDIYDALTDNCIFAIAEASVAEIDHMNILCASMLAMERAVGLLSAGNRPLRRGLFPVAPKPLAQADRGNDDREKEVYKIDLALIDGNRAPELSCPALPLVKGDDKSLSIAAASIIAKVYRDRMMTKLAAEFPYYGWQHNAGYGTAEHLAALTIHGVTPWHRQSFAPVRHCLDKAAV